MALYAIGDLHGFQMPLYSMLKSSLIGLGKEDYLFVCGDWGFWFEQSHSEKMFIQDLNGILNFTMCVIDGNHDAPFTNFPTETWNGGTIDRLAPNIVHLRRGEIYNIQGHTVFTFGGAASMDKCYRLANNEPWYPEEIPTQAEYDNAIKNLQSVRYKVDYIFTHTLYESGMDLLFEHLKIMGYSDEKKHNTADLKLRNFLEDVYGKCLFKWWFAGHFHMDLLLKSPKRFSFSNQDFDSKYPKEVSVVYKNVIKITD